jgi:ferritin
METDETKDAVVAFTVRLPYDSHKDLRRICLEHEVTVNGQINALIGNFLEEHDDCAYCH